MQARSGVFLGLVAAVAILLGEVNTFAAPHRIVASDGSSAPDSPPGATLRAFDTPSINEAGEVAFVGYHSSSLPSPAYSAIYAEDGQGLRLVAGRGLQVPGAEPGFVFNEFDSAWPVINDRGQVRFYARMTGGDISVTYNEALFVSDQSSLDMLARAGAPAPGLGEGVVFRRLTNLNNNLNNSGQTSFYALLQGPGIDFSNQAAYYSGGVDGVTPYAQNSGTLEGTDATYASFSSFNPPIDHAGRVTFLPWLAGLDGTPFSRRAVVTGQPDGLRVLISEGAPVPGSVAGETIQDLTGFGQNQAGDWLIVAQTVSDVINTSRDEAIFLNQQGLASVVAREGDRLPWSEGSRAVLEFAGATLSERGDVLFRGYTRNPQPLVLGGAAYYLWSEGETRLLMAEGSLLPGAAPGEVVHSVGQSLMNSEGQGVLSAELRDPSNSTFQTRTGIWSFDRTGRLSLIALEGESLPARGPDGVVPVFVSYLDALGLSSLNNRGQFAFATNDHLLVAQLIPEPSTAAILLAACLTLPTHTALRRVY